MTSIFRAATIAGAVLGIIVTTGGAVWTAFERVVEKPLLAEREQLTKQLDELRKALASNDHALQQDRNLLSACRADLHAVTQKSDGGVCEGVLASLKSANERLESQVIILSEKLESSQSTAGPKDSVSQTSEKPIPRTQNGPQGNAQTEQSVESIQWDTTAKKWEDRVGQRFSFSCPAMGAVDRVYGEGDYSVRSSICSAAVHAGKFTAGSGGTVTIQIIGAVDGVRKGTLRQGIRSMSYFGSLSFKIE